MIVVIRRSLKKISTSKTPQKQIAFKTTLKNEKHHESKNMDNLDMIIVHKIYNHI